MTRYDLSAVVWAFLSLFTSLSLLPFPSIFLHLFRIPLWYVLIVMRRGAFDVLFFFPFACFTFPYSLSCNSVKSS